MFRESTAKVKQSHGAQHALTPSRISRRIWVSSALVLLATAVLPLGLSTATAAQVSNIQPSAIPAGATSTTQPATVSAEAVDINPLAVADAAIKYYMDVQTLLRALAAQRISYDRNLWMQVHVCEQGDTWHAGGHFGNGAPAGGNGLGFSADAWRQAVGYAADRGVTLPASGWNATPDQQMQAAQAMLDRLHGGPDCLNSIRH